MICNKQLWVFTEGEKLGTFFQLKYINATIIIFMSDIGLFILERYLYRSTELLVTRLRLLLCLFYDIYSWIKSIYV